MFKLYRRYANIKRPRTAGLGYRSYFGVSTTNTNSSSRHSKSEKHTVMNGMEFTGTRETTSWERSRVWQGRVSFCVSFSSSAPASVKPRDLVE